MGQSTNQPINQSTHPFIHAIAPAATARKRQHRLLLLLLLLLLPTLKCRCVVVEGETQPQRGADHKG